MLKDFCHLEEFDCSHFSLRKLDSILHCECFQYLLDGIVTIFIPFLSLVLIAFMTTFVSQSGSYTQLQLIFLMDKVLNLTEKATLHHFLCIIHPCILLKG